MNRRVLPIGFLLVLMAPHVAWATDTRASDGTANQTEAAPASEASKPTRDPLFPLQWMLRNRTPSFFGPQLVSHGIDLNVMPVHNMGITGKGVRVMVVDDGVDIEHEDLAANVDVSMVHTYGPGLEKYDTHGTAMAGIIGAVAGNGVGGYGIAPGVRLGSVDFLQIPEDSPLMNTPEKSAKLLADIFGGAPFSRQVDVFSGSYNSYEGPSVEKSIATWARFESSGHVNALRQLRRMRGGRGAIFVTSAGNEHKRIVSADGDTSQAPCRRALANKLSCMDAGFTSMANSVHAMVVTAVNAKGKRANYSSTGSVTLVSGLGSDAGLTAQASDESEPSPPLVTTDLAGCDRGAFTQRSLTDDYQSMFSSVAGLWEAFSRHCDYGFTSGTSSAAATVSGVVALMLEANPDLTWRDVRMILARTSRVVDAKAAPVRIRLGDGSEYIALPSWTRNGAGLWFHNAYGYGLVNAAAAVRTAQKWTRHLAEPMTDTGWVESAGYERTTGTAGTPIPHDSARGAGSPLNVAQRGFVEYVQVRVRLADANLADLAVELTSPSGTRSVLRAPYAAYGDLGAEEDVLFASNAFMAEPMKGDWRFRVINVGTPDRGSNPALLGWTLRIVGGQDRPLGHGDQTVQENSGAQPRWIRAGQALPL